MVFLKKIFNFIKLFFKPGKGAEKLDDTFFDKIKTGTCFKSPNMVYHEISKLKALKRGLSKGPVTFTEYAYILTLDIWSNVASKNTDTARDKVAELNKLTSIWLEEMDNAKEG